MTQQTLKVNLSERHTLYVCSSRNTSQVPLKSQWRSEEKNHLVTEFTLRLILTVMTCVCVCVCRDVNCVTVCPKIDWDRKDRNQPLKIKSLHTHSHIHVSVPSLDCSNIPPLTQQLLEPQPIRGLDLLTPLGPSPSHCPSNRKRKDKATVCETELNLTGKTAEDWLQTTKLMCVRVCVCVWQTHTGCWVNTHFLSWFSGL